MVPRSIPAALLLLAAFSPGCGSPARTATPAASADPSVLAEVDGVPITAEEVDRHAAGELQRVRQQEYEVRRNALDALVTQRLFKQEAAKRGVSEQDLMRLEVAEKVAHPAASEIQEVYDANRGRVGGRTRAEVEPQIVSSLMQQRTAERKRAFTESLRDQAKVKIVLDQPRTDVVIPAGTAVLGPADAPITIIEFSDYLCPYCQAAEAVVSKVLEKHQGKVKFIHRDFLLGRPRSLAVARGALCAGEQGKFWEYRHDLLSSTGDWSDQDLAGRAAKMGLRSADFRSCLASDRLDQAILSSSEQGQTLGVSGTPTYFVNGRRMTGVRTEQQFDAMIQDELRDRG